MNIYLLEVGHFRAPGIVGWVAELNMFLTGLLLQKNAGFGTVANAFYSVQLENTEMTITCTCLAATFSCIIFSSIKTRRGNFYGLGTLEVAKC
jgi:hypothetical protein